MKNHVCRRALSFAIAVLLTVGSVFTAPATEVSAAAAPSKIKLSATQQTIGVGQTFTLKVKSVTPKKASKKVTFKSSNKKVATVTNKGKVKGIKAGTAKITVTSTAKKSVKATCKVTVAAITEKNAKNGVLTVDVKKSITLKPSMSPKSVAVAGYTYSVKDSKVATVTNKGKLTGVKAGKTTLTIKSKKKKNADPVFTLKLTVNVTKPADSTQTPDSEQPSTQTPDSEQPDTQAPGVWEPESEEPESEIPDVDDPNAIRRWKFDFGSTTDVADGYTAVAADKDYYAEGNTDGYGFLGINEKSDKIGDRLDGFGNQLGQVQELKTGGGTGLNDAVGCVGIVGQEDPLGDEYYPTRFALKVDEDTYYKVTATVTTLDPTKDASATLYTERKHPIYTDKTIKAGRTYRTVFTIRVTPIYYQKSTPSGLIADGMVNVCVAGDNTALAALKIEQLETAPTLWVLGDSTVTDGNTDLPFFRLQNYTGVGTGLTKYLPGDIAMVNEGEGGLNAADNLHYDVVAARIKEGDWLYVEYGHNHKDDGPEGYKTALEKYYTLCNDKKAKLIIVSPIERINTFAGDAYQHSLEGFARAGEAFVQEKIAAGAANIAFVDLNKTSLEFYNQVTTDNGGSADAIKFYFCTLKGGTTDPTHPNDAGAENLAYCFFEAAKAVTDETQKAVLAGLLDNMRNEKPNLVPESITSLGKAPNSAWPTYDLPINEEYPVAIKDVLFDEDGTLSSVKVNVQRAKNSMTSYGIIVITIQNASGDVKGTIYAVDQVDNSTGLGPQTISKFRSVDASGASADIKLAEGDQFEAIVLKAVDGTVLVPEDPRVEYSKKFTKDDISDIDTYLLPGESGDIEDFDYFARTDLESTNKWFFGGSSNRDLSFGKEEDGRIYTNLNTSDAKGSWFVWRNLENLTGGTGNSGNYMVEMDLKYISGTNLKFSFVQNMANKTPFASGDMADILAVGTNGALTSHGTALTAALTPGEWTHVKYVLHMDAGTAEITVEGNETQTVNIPEFATFGDVSVSTYNYFVITQTANRSVFSAQLSNLAVAKLKETTAKVTVTAGLTDDAAGLGTVKINGAETGTAQVTQGSKVTFEAVAQEGKNSGFIGWYTDDSEKPYSTSMKLTVRAYRDFAVKAKFIVGTKTNVVVNLKDDEGNVIKSDTIQEVDGIALYEQQMFTLPDSYKQILKTADGGLTKIYFYDEAANKKTAIDALGAAGSNTIDIVYEYDGIYDEFEDFSSSELTPANWGFTAGNAGDIAWQEDGSLGLYLGATDKKTNSDVKTLSTEVSSAKKITVRFDWRTDTEATNGRYSLFDLKDSGGNVIFSLLGKGTKGGKGGIRYAVNDVATDESIQVGSPTDWVRVKLTMDFDTKKISGTIVNLTTGIETKIAETALTKATNLATLNADYGYSVASQRLDNFGILYTAE